MAELNGAVNIQRAALIFLAASCLLTICFSDAFVDDKIKGCWRWGLGGR